MRTDTLHSHRRISLAMTTSWLTLLMLSSGALVQCVRPRAAGAETYAATVAGAQRVFVRRGPGTGFLPFASIPKGTTVQVEEIEGDWARITTSSGQVGYINKAFLSRTGSAEAEAPAASTPAAGAPAAAASAPVPQAAAPARSVQGGSAATDQLAERNKDLEAQVRKLERQLAEAQSRADATPVATATVAPSPMSPAVGGEAGDARQIRTELARLSAAVEAMQHTAATRQVAPEAAPLPEEPLDAPPHAVSSSALLLGIVGLLIGWLFGSSYGRRQERGRRSRIRF